MVLYIFCLYIIFLWVLKINFRQTLCQIADLAAHPNFEIFFCLEQIRNKNSRRLGWEWIHSNIEHRIDGFKMEYYSAVVKINLCFLYQQKWVWNIDEQLITFKAFVFKYSKNNLSKNISRACIFCVHYIQWDEKNMNKLFTE